MSIDNTSFFSYIYSSWLTKYLWKAYRKGITLSDIPDISPLDSCAYNIRKFENLWNQELRQRGPTSASLTRIAWRFVSVRFLISCTLNICSQITRFILYALLLRKILEFSENADTDFSHGMHWVILIVIFDILQMTLSTWSDIMNQRTAIRLKGACLSLLFKKVMNTNNFIHKNADEVVNMLSGDGHKIYNAVNYGTMVVNAPVAIVCSLFCIPMWLSPIALLGLIAYLLFYLLQYWLTHLIDYCKETANELTKSRVQKTIEVLNNIRLIKINGWEQHFIQLITSLRSNESKWLWKLAYVRSISSSTAYAIPVIATIVTFFMHFTICHNLTASMAFPICIVFIVQIHGAIAESIRAVSYLRISRDTLEKMKNRLHSEDISSQIMKPYEASQAVAIVNGTFIYDHCDKNNYLLEETDNARDVVTNHANNNNNSTEILEPEKQKLQTLKLEPKKFKVLRDINFKARKGQLIGICGRANSGKSSLLLAALGQIRMTNGQLMRQGSCAYVAQKPWIADATVRENILFEEAYDAKRYYEAQVVTKLREDVKMLPNGDETDIGEEGVEITENFKQKIALARAFYADRDIYFLDEILASMEESIAHEIFEDLIIRALAEKTILLITNDYEYLDRCDYVYVLRDGQIAEHGRHKNLMRLRREYASIVKASITDAEGDYAHDYNDGDDNAAPERRKSIVRQPPVFQERRLSTIKQPYIATPERRVSVIKQETQDNTPKETVQNCVQQNETSISCSSDDDGLEETQAKTYYLYTRFLGGFSLMLPVLIAYAIYASILILSLLRLAWWIESINENNHSERTRHSSFIFYRNWYGFCLFLVLVGCVVQSFVAQTAIIEIADNMHNALLNRLMHAHIRFFEAVPFEIIRNRFQIDLNKVSVLLPMKLDNLLRYLTLGLFMFSILISTIPWFTNYVIITTVILIFAVKIYRTAQLNFVQLGRQLRLITNSFLRNSVLGLSTIRTFKKENEILSKFQDLLDENSTYCFLKGTSESWLSIRLQILTTSCLFVATTLFVFMKGDISSATGGLAFLYVLQMPNTIIMVIKYILKTEKSFMSVQNLCSYLSSLEDGESDKMTISFLSADWPTSGTIEFSDVPLGYSEEGQLSTDQISLTINKNEKIGILAMTELDKSFLIAALFRLYELNRGEIFLDSVAISKVELKFLRKQMSIIPRCPIFYGTIRYFLDPTKAHADSDIWNALEKVYMKDKVSALASQLHSASEKMFNTGEKQLLFLARAILAQTKVLVLEENDSSQQPETTALIYQVVQKEFFSSTVLIFASRFQTLQACDRVLVLDNGRKVDFDTPSILISNEDSHLAKMKAEVERQNREM